MSNLSITMIGTGSPRFDLERSGPSQLLTIGDTPILIDCGEGTCKQLLKAGIPPQSIEHLWLTHLHSDHMFGYANFLIGGWSHGRHKLTVVGPRGIKKYHDTLLDLFKEDIEYRLSVGRTPEGILDVQIIEIDEPGVIPTELPATVTSAKMLHNVTTFAYRFDIGEKSVVFAGDTAPTPTIVELSKGADVLVMDSCMAVDKERKQITEPALKKIWGNLLKEHCTPAQAAEAARDAGVKQVILTHFLPNVDTELAYQEATEVFSGKVIVAEDLQTIKVE